MNEVDILIISNLKDFTTDYVCIELNKRNCKYLRLNRDLFHTYLVDFNIDTLELKLQIENQEYFVSNESLKSVYYRAPIYLHYMPKKELSYDEQLFRSQWMAFIRNLMLFENARWMNNPEATFKSENKMLQIEYARQCGFLCPSTRLVNSVNEAHLDENQTYVVKSLDTVILRQGSEEVFSYTNVLRGQEIANANLQMAPVIIQENITPKIDIRVTVVANTVFPVKIVNSNNYGISGDWRRQKDSAQFIAIDLPQDIKEACVNLTNKLGLSFGGIDLVLSSDKYYFIEINPTGEWAWLVNSANQHIDEAICDFLCQKNFMNTQDDSEKIWDYLFPFYRLHKSNKTISKKIKALSDFPDEYELEYATKDMRIEKYVLEEALATTLTTKNELEDKSKSSLIAITISSALIFNIVQMLQDISNSSLAVSIVLIIISCISLLYMVIAGVLSLYSISDINRVSFLFPEDHLLSENKQKQELAQSIEANYLYNTKRNNCMCASYRCIIVSLALFIVIFLVSSISMISVNTKNNEIEAKFATIETRLTVIEDNVKSQAHIDEETRKILSDIKSEMSSLSNRIDEVQKDAADNKNRIQEITERINSLSSP